MKISNPLFFVLPFLGASSGCFHSVDKNMAKTASYPSLEGVLQKTAGLFSCSESKGPWWEIFEDDQLNALMTKALRSSPTLQKAQSRVVAAQASAKSVRSKLFPSVDATAADTWQYLSRYGLIRDFFPSSPEAPIPSKFNEVDLFLDFSYEIDFWSKNRKMFKAALGRAAAEQMEKLDTELLLCTAIASTYFNLQTRFAELTLQKKKLACQKELLSLYKNRYETGIEGVKRSLKEDAKLLTLMEQIEELEKNLSIDEFFLKELIGEGPDCDLGILPREKLPYENAGLPKNLELNLLSGRPDVIAQIWQVEAAREEVGVAKTEFYPNVNLRALAGLSTLSFSHLFDFASRNGTLQPAINLPLFTGGRLTANLEDKAAKYNEAVYAYNELILKAAKEIATELTVYGYIDKELEMQEKKIQVEKKLHSVAVSSFQFGIDTYAPVLSAEKTLIEEELYAVRLQNDKVASLLAIIKALGGGMAKEEVQ